MAVQNQPFINPCSDLSVWGQFWSAPASLAPQHAETLSLCDGVEQTEEGRTYLNSHATQGGQVQVLQ